MYTHNYIYSSHNISDMYKYMYIRMYMYSFDNIWNWNKTFSITTTPLSLFSLFYPPSLNGLCLSFILHKNFSIFVLRRLPCTSTVVGKWGVCGRTFQHVNWVEQTVEKHACTIWVHSQTCVRTLMLDASGTLIVLAPAPIASARQWARPGGVPTNPPCWKAMQETAPETVGACSSNYTRPKLPYVNPLSMLYCTDSDCCSSSSVHGVDLAPANSIIVLQNLFY